MRLTKHDEAKFFLREILTPLPLPPHVVRQEAAKRGIKITTLDIAKRSIGIRVRRGPNDGPYWTYTWGLPEWLLTGPCSLNKRGQ
jgi:hypothetical protein